jgi:hypothetical protein
MIPALYEGFGGDYSLLDKQPLKLYGYRIYRFKPFSSDTFGKGDTGAPEVDDTTIPRSTAMVSPPSVCAMASCTMPRPSLVLSL